jgi:hypothetical protein
LGKSICKQQKAMKKILSASHMALPYLFSVRVTNQSLVLVISTGIKDAQL